MTIALGRHGRTVHIPPVDGMPPVDLTDRC
jgi:hypothetical protein